MITLPAVPGRVYFPPCSPTTLLVAANTFYAVPFIAPKASRGFNQMGIRVTTAGAGAGADVRLALYVDADGRPGDLINAFGPITGLTAPGAYGVDFNPPVGLNTKGQLWLACVFNQAASTMPTVAATGATALTAAAFGAGSLVGLPSTADDMPAGVSASMAYGAFPDRAPVVAPVVGAAVPLIGLRVV